MRRLVELQHWMYLNFVRLLVGDDHVRRRTTTLDVFKFDLHVIASITVSGRTTTLDVFKFRY